MAFEQPIWLILVLPAAICLYLWPPATRWLKISRAILLLLLVLALAHPYLKLPDRAGTVVVVADRSLSLPPGATDLQREVIHTLQQAMGSRDRLAVVAFGETSAVERPPQRGPFAGFTAEVGPDQSHLAAGLETALSLIPPDHPGRILVLSDGRWTGRDPASATARAAERGIALDYRLLARPAVNEISIQRFDLPSSLAPDQAFFINAWVESPTDQEVVFQLLRGSRVLAAGTRQFTAGINRLMFRDRAPAEGTLDYRLVVTGAERDPCPENNEARALVAVRAPRSILAIAEAGRSSGLQDLLRRGGLSIAGKTPTEAGWSLEDLAQYAAVVLENVMANHLGQAGLETLATWIEQTGSGLMLTGGRKSYGPGGYYRSPLERILPISLEMRQEHRKARVAIAVTLDRSGSMAAPAGAGRTKMDLANLGTAGVLDMLMPSDEFGVIAVDSSAHLIVDLNTVANNQAMRDRILRIDSRGGGIFIFEALSAAARMLLQAQAEAKHIILFADAADSEEPGQYRDLIQRCREANITISVVGLGRPEDVDAPLLEDIALLGGGSCYFTQVPDELPRLFAQDTFTVARSTFIDEPTSFHVAAGMVSLGGQAGWQPPPLGGYNLCYVRPEATLAAISADEYAAPIVAAWQAGNGRVLCFTGEADGESSGPFAQWDQAGEFYSSLARWTAGDIEKSSDEVMITHEIHEGACRIELHLDPARTRDPFREIPSAKLLRGLRGQPPTTSTAAFEWVSADLLRATVPIRGQETVLPIVNLPGRRPATLAPVCLPYSPEFKPDSAGRGPATLRRLADTTGGQERIDLAGLWKALPSKPRQVLLTPWFAACALLLFLIEILERRTGLVSRWVPRRPQFLMTSKARPPADSQTTPSSATPSRTTSPAWAPAAAPTSASAAVDSTRSDQSAAAPAKDSSPTPAPASSSPWSDLKRARQRARARRRSGDQEP